MHFYAVTGDGSVSTLYIDGQKVGTAKTYKPLTTSSYYLNGWTNTNAYNANCLMSDFRVYATCLSDADIKELYNTPVSIANNGTMLVAGEIVEV